MAKLDGRSRTVLSRGVAGATCALALILAVANSAAAEERTAFGAPANDVRQEPRISTRTSSVPGFKSDPKVPAALLRPEDVFRLERAADVQISPNGRQVAYVRVTPNVATDGRDRSIWLVERSTGRQSRLAKDGDSPRWSPDGGRIAFVATDGRRGARLLVVSMAHPAHALRIADGECEHPAWAPDGSTIACTKFVPEDAETFDARLPAKPAGATWAPDPHVQTGPRFRDDGSGYYVPGANRLRLISSSGGRERMLDLSGLSVQGEPSWDPAGGRLVFAATKADDVWEQAPALYDVDVRSNLVRALSSGPGAFASPRVAPDGLSIAYLRHDAGRIIWQQHLGIMARDGGDMRDVQTRLDRDVLDARWSAGGRLFFSYEDAGKTSIARATSDEGRMVLTRNAAGGDLSLSADGAVGFAAGLLDRPEQAAVADGGVRMLTCLDRDLLRTRAVGKVISLDARSSFDGMRVPGWAILPPNHVAGRSYPAILWIHGGPYGFEGPAWRSDLQLMAAAGYVVLYANPRGSTSYGWAHTQALPTAAPGHDYDDLMSFVDAAIAMGLADPRRLYVAGSSYGGIMTAWIVGRTGRFRAAVAEKAAVDLPSNYVGNDQYQNLPRDPRGLPWQAQSAWWRASPMSRVGSVSTPTMLIVGDEDRRTPLEQSLQFYDALQLRHVPSALVVYPGASHGSLGKAPSQLVSKTRYALAWFEGHRPD